MREIPTPKELNRSYWDLKRSQALDVQRDLIEAVYGTTGNERVVSEPIDNDVARVWLDEFPKRWVRQGWEVSYNADCEDLTIIIIAPRSFNEN